MVKVYIFYYEMLMIDGLQDIRLTDLIRLILNKSISNVIIPSLYISLAKEHNKTYCNMARKIDKTSECKLLDNLYLDIMRQSASLVVNPITVYSYGFIFYCTTVGQASDSMMALM